MFYFQIPYGLGTMQTKCCQFVKICLSILKTIIPLEQAHKTELQKTD